MKRFVIVVIVMSLLWASATNAASAEDTNVTQAYARLMHRLGPTDCTPEQRSHLALSLAVIETQTTDPTILHSPQDYLSTAAVELLMSDTSYYWEEDAWVGESRSTYSYDASNRVSMDVYQYFTGTSWVNSMQLLYHYDGSSRMDTVVAKGWQSGEWVNDNRTIYSSFNAYGMPGSVKVQVWKGSSWADTLRTTRTFNGADLNVVTVEAWTGSAWVNQGKTTYTFTGGNLTETLTQFWQGGVWVNASRITSTWLNGNESERISQTWVSTAWMDITKSEYTHDAGDNLILEIRSMWFTVMWMPSHKDTLIYVADRLSEKITYGLLDGSQLRRQYTYTAGGNLSLELTQTWDMVGSSWLNQGRQVYVYSGATTCQGTTGNVDNVGIVDLSDLSLLIAYLTIPAPNKPTLPAPGEANIDAVGIIDLSDLSLLIAYLTIPAPNKPVLPNCP